MNVLGAQQVRVGGERELGRRVGWLVDYFVGTENKAWGWKGGEGNLWSPIRESKSTIPASWKKSTMVMPGCGVVEPVVELMAEPPFFETGKRGPSKSRT